MDQAVLIALEATNNSNYQIDVSLLDGLNADNPGTAKSLYPYDFSAEDFIGATSIDLKYSLAIAPLDFINITAPLTLLNLEGVLMALNSFGVGTFHLQGTTIFVYSDFYIYDDIVVL